jgi:hypothetical protein
MNTTGLHNLHKDELIMLVATIREQTRQEVLDEIKQKTAVNHMRVCMCGFCSHVYSLYHEWHQTVPHGNPVCQNCEKTFGPTDMRLIKMDKKKTLFKEGPI